MASLVKLAAKSAGAARPSSAGAATAMMPRRLSGVSSNAASTVPTTTMATATRRALLRGHVLDTAVPLLGSQVNRCVRRAGGWRQQQQQQQPPRAGFSTKGEEAGGAKAEDKAEEGEQQQEQQQEQQEEGEGQQEDPDPEQPQEKIGFLKGLLYLTVAGVAAGSLYFIIDELMPSRLSANYLFNEAFDAVKANHEVLNRYGEPLKGYGRDGGGRREGRRNFVEHKNYVAEDGTKRLRIRFNIEGPFGTAFVFAEVTSEMGKGQWMYLLVQDMQTGRVLTVEDNRAMHEAVSKAQSPEERAALQALIQSGGGGGSGGSGQY